MTLINKQINAALQGLMGEGVLEKMVTKEWQKKASCLANLTNHNKHNLKKIDLKLLKGLKYEGTDAQTLFDFLKKSDDINEYQKNFARFLYDNYTKHSLKAQGFGE